MTIESPKQFGFRSLFLCLLCLLTITGALGCGDHELTNEELISQLLSPDREERLKATVAIGSRGEKSAVAHEYLVDALNNDQSFLVRQHAARAIAWVAPQSEVSVNALISALSDSHWAVRRAAAEALGDIGPFARKAVPTLITTMNEFWMARAAVDTVQWFVRPDALEQFQIPSETFLKNIWSLSLTIVDALGRIGPDSASAIPALIPFIHYPDTDGQTRTTVALGKIGIRALTARKDIEPLLNSPEVNVRRAAALTLGQINARESIPLLTKLLEDKSSEMRKVAASALRTINTPASLDPLKQRVKSLIPLLQEKNWDVRRDAATALEELDTAEAKEALKTHRRFFPNT